MDNKNSRNADSHVTARTLPALAALVVAGGGFLLFVNSVDNFDPAALSPYDCREQQSNSSGCAPAVAAEQTPPGAIGSDAPRAAPHAGGDVDIRNRYPRRAWQQQGSAAALRPGQTLVELCTNSDAIDPLPCRSQATRKIAVPKITAVGDDSDAGHAISGKVLSAHGEPLDGVSVVASPYRLDDAEIDSSENLRYWTATDAYGAYSISGLPAGEYSVRSARHGSYQPARILARSGVDYADLVMNQDLEVLIGGRIINELGEPLDGVTVFPKLLGQRSAQSGADGRFELPMLVKPSVISVSLSFRAPGYKEQNAKVRLAELPRRDDGLSIVMDTVNSWTSLAGSVRDDAGRPVVGYRVELRPRAGGKTQHISTDDSGHYSFAFVESPADYQLLLDGGDSFKDVERNIRVTTEMEPVDLVAETYEIGTVAGRLLNQSGAAIADFDLVLRNVQSRGSNTVVSTDSLGNFEIPAPAGELIISSLSTPTVLVQGLRVEPGQKVYLPLVLDWGGHSIRGLVLDSGGNPVPASRVILKWSREDNRVNTLATRRTVTDAHGQFAFTNLGPGPHSLRVDAPGFLGVEIDHDLRRKGYDLTVELTSI